MLVLLEQFVNKDFILMISKTKGKKISKKKAKSKKVNKKVKSSKFKRKNPNYKIRSYKTVDFEYEYIKLSDFEFQFTREANALGDDGYYDYDYEIDNILKYEYGSNAVSSGVVKLISLSIFKKIVKQGLAYFDDKNIIEAFNNTLSRIPDNVRVIDIGN